MQTNLITQPISQSASRQQPNNTTNIHSQSQDISTLDLHYSTEQHPCTEEEGTTPLKRTLPVPDHTQLSSIKINLLRRWILTFALINFDLDEGPDFDNCYPPLPLSSSQMSNIAFSSFPDCAKSGSLIFSWRIPDNSSASSLSLPTPEPTLKLTPPSPATTTTTRQRRAITTSPSKPHLPSSDLSGYVYFVQERDPSVFRGYNQRSLVLITHLPDYVGLFSTLVARLGPLYSTQGAKSLETALENIISWPDPTPGKNLELRFLGQDHQFIIPHPNQAQIPDPRCSFPGVTGSLDDPRLSQHQQRNPSPLDYRVLASNPTTYLSYILFGNTPHPSSSSSSSSAAAAAASAYPAHSSSSSNAAALSISSLWLLWEILILAEPLVVFGATPDIVSNTVLHLKNLIRPIPFHANWRPYITIHDPDFGLLFGRNKARAVGLIGATNPIILTSTHAWPNVLSLSHQGASFNHHIGLLTDHKRVLHKNKAVVKQLLMCLERKDYHHADIVISRHFSVLTEQFLQPLQRYFTTLLPTAEGTSTAPQRTGSFNSEVFLKSLKEHTTALEFRSRLMAGFTATSVSVPGFYTAFLRSPNFSAWLHRQLVLGNRAVRDRFANHSSSRHPSFSSSNAAPVATAPSPPSCVPNEPLHQVIKRLHAQLSKKPTSSGLSPNSNNNNNNNNNNNGVQPHHHRGKKEFSTVSMGRSVSGSSSSKKSSQGSGVGGAGAREEERRTSSMDLDGASRGAGVGGVGGGGGGLTVKSGHGLKKSWTIGGGRSRMRRSSSTVSDASGSSTDHDLVDEDDATRTLRAFVPSHSRASSSAHSSGSVTCTPSIPAHPPPFCPLSDSGSPAQKPLPPLPASRDSSPASSVGSHAPVASSLLSSLAFSSPRTHCPFP
ncbi:hypothetical protein PCANC_05710 [Puccinia coronata f. sp. avenae]|uniref:UDENN domain-containing protein n=2 Tax=Puccinia coronata f. sp. avenae TaxID=200324 RepID=A0A2N5VY53_9BASI|nr:hypothetical protein PCANC_05710 [Puccinia coronata f. sp. avenae]